MKIYIKNMVCERCKTVVGNELEKLKIETLDMSLGEITIGEGIRLSPLALVLAPYFQLKTKKWN